MLTQKIRRFLRSLRRSEFWKAADRGKALVPPLKPRTDRGACYRELPRMRLSLRFNPAGVIGCGRLWVGA